ncbi:hypothetical protein BK133_02790 [Paenibacillus sp. FSL H8-0548]|uniref:hypothetical protein n=1 Tax=Paenibacillus sp. FSL H8-0548 TaxID=1920422 RepID=UPI00096D82D3|nr:hypothetical protein [Paenibacillus sp. FSL H8-0548]OMF38462.1 hypothetical protein BK133_02790 [Paenibacillus sp. FSL H8-0548]
MTNKVKPQWAELLKDSPFDQPHFSETIKSKIRQKTKIKNKGKLRIAIILLAAAALSSIFLYLFIVDNEKMTEPIDERNAYYDRGELLLQVFPEPDLQAGSPTGYVFNFSEPFTIYQGKELFIRAIHINTGQQVVAVPTVKITEPSSGYKSLERFTANFALPLGGLWRFEVELDGHYYGDVILSVKDPLWELSSEFKSASYMLRGKDQNVGFIDPGFIAGKINKYMWHLWDNNRDLNGEFTVKAVKKGDDHMIEVFSGSNLGGSLNDADRSIPSSMSLPIAGVWRLLPMVGGRLVDSIVIEVNE